MKSFREYISEVIYNDPNTAKLADQEHDETKHQSDAIHQGHMDDIHPAIRNAIHKFAASKSAFQTAMRQSKIDKIRRDDKISNTEIGQGSQSVEDKTKVNRVKKQIGSGRIDRPIVLRHKDSTGQVHKHLLAGNTRATTVGYGVQAHHIDV